MDVMVTWSKVSPVSSSLPSVGDPWSGGFLSLHITCPPATLQPNLKWDMDMLSWDDPGEQGSAGTMWGFGQSCRVVLCLLEGLYFPRIAAMAMAAC